MRIARSLARHRRAGVLAVSAVFIATAFVPVESPVGEPVAQRVVATPAPPAVITPNSMAIPKIGLEAPVVPVGTEPDGTMGSPTNAVDVGWWLGRRPGEGNALFAAHRDWSGRLGSFYRLQELVPGDDVVVQGEEGRTLVYRVVWVKNFDHDMDATELLGNSDGGQVATLITCDGPFDRSIGTSRERVVARAELVSA